MTPPVGSRYGSVRLRSSLSARVAQSCREKQRVCVILSSLLSLDRGGIPRLVSVANGSVCFTPLAKRQKNAEGKVGMGGNAAAGALASRSDSRHCLRLTALSQTSQLTALSLAPAEMLYCIAAFAFSPKSSGRKSDHFDW